MDDFQGDRLCHSSQFRGANSDSNGKKAIVVGCCNSGHDIAQDFYEHGYDVTLVQRSSTYVMASKAGLEVLLGGLYEEGGPETEDADLMFMSIPNPMLKRMHLDATKEIERRDADLLAGLQKAVGTFSFWWQLRASLQDLGPGGSCIPPHLFHHMWIMLYSGCISWLIT